MSKLVLIVGSICLLLGTFFGSEYMANKKDVVIAKIHTEYAEKAEVEALATATGLGLLVADLNAVTEQANQLRAENQAISEKHFKEMRDAQKKSDDLATDLILARQRLSVRVASGGVHSDGVSGACPGGSLDDGAGARAELHPEVSANLVRLMGEADQCRAKLTGFQALKGPKPVP